MKTFIIHLPRAEGRKAQVARLLETAPFDPEVLDAVDGAALSDNDRSDICALKPLNNPAYPFPLNAGEIGCFLSHRLAWRKIVDAGYDAALILEDDVDLDLPVFQSALDLAKANIAQFGYIQFQVRDLKGPSREIATTSGAALVQRDVVPLRTSAQLVSAAAAQRLLDASEQIDRPVDTFVQMHWITGVHPVCAVPSGVSDRTAQTGGSQISRSKPLGERLSREFKRARYRRAVRKASAR